MKNFYSLIVFALLFLFSCSTGKKALQKGDYYSAVNKAVDRLKSSPENKNALEVLKEGYPMTLEWSQEELDIALTSGNMFKWEKCIEIMEQVNHLAENIRSTPAARKIITSPKIYSTELNLAFQNAAEARYREGLNNLETKTRESARKAFENFIVADRYVNGYKNVASLLEKSKKLATVQVMVEAIPVNTIKYKLSSEFFYNQVFEYLNNQFPQKSFVNFFTPSQAEKYGLSRPDFVIKMAFFDFSVGNQTHTEKEENLENKVKIENKDTTIIEYKTYKAKLKTFTDAVVSGGNLQLRINETTSGKSLLDDLVPGSFTWVNEYALFVGDKEALDKKQLDLTKNKVRPLIPDQELFIEFTKPIYDQVTGKLNQFFRKYN